LSGDETADERNDFGRREADASRARNMSWWFRAAFDVDGFGVVGDCVESLLSLGCMVVILLIETRCLSNVWLCTPSIISSCSVTDNSICEIRNGGWGWECWWGLE
jgi:hypothetical protein